MMYDSIKAPPVWKTQNGNKNNTKRMWNLSFEKLYLKGTASQNSKCANSSRKLCLFKNKFNNFSLQSNIRKLVNCLLNFLPSFDKFVFDLSKRQVMVFCPKFSDLYIIDNDELLSWFKK